MHIASLHNLVTTKYFGIFLSAFLGAFFAYLFTRIGTLADRLFNRKQKHRTGLVAIEKQGNEYQNYIGDNLFVADDYIKIAKRRLTDKKPFIYFNELHELPIDKKIYPMIGNIDMVNELFSLEASVAKINSSIRSLNRFMGLIQDAFINQKIDLATYLVNVKIMIEKFAEITVFLHDLEEENKKLIAKTRVLLKTSNHSFYIFLLSKLMRKKFTKRQTKRFPLELKKLNKEIEDTKSNDRKRIDKLLQAIEENKK